MVHQSCSHLRLKEREYYFSRRVPERIQKHFKTDRVEVRLHTQLVSTELQLFERLLAETFRLLLMLYVSLEVAAKVRCSPLVAVWGLCSI